VKPQPFLFHTRLDILTAVNIKNTIFWDIISCVSLIDKYQHFGETTATIFRIVLPIQCHIPENGSFIILIPADVPLSHYNPFPSLKSLRHGSIIHWNYHVFGLSLPGKTAGNKFLQNIGTTLPN
jgi:hypothetical protein